MQGHEGWEQTVGIFTSFRNFSNTNGLTSLSQCLKVLRADLFFNCCVSNYLKKNSLASLRGVILFENVLVKLGITSFPNHRHFYVLVLRRPFAFTELLDFSSPLHNPSFINDFFNHLQKSSKHLNRLPRV